jgi:hypothetical protein
MADEKAVPRAELAALLGLPPDTDEATLRRAMADLVATHEAREADAIAAAAEQRLQAEDKRIVAAAINEGKLPKDRFEFWCSALQQDRPKNRSIISVISPARPPLPPAERVGVDGDLQRVHAKVMAQLGVPQPLRSVAASGDPQADLRERAVLDAFGLPVAQVPPPVLLRKGTSPADYTPEQQYQDFAHKLGGKFTEGVPRPPAGDTWYAPSPNDVTEFVNGEWREKHPYRELP